MCACAAYVSVGAEKVRELERIRAGKEMQKAAEKEKEMALKRMIEVGRSTGPAWTCAACSRCSTGPACAALRCSGAACAA